MRRSALAFSFSVAVATTFACAHDRDASMSKSQCAAGDWETVGYRDGTLGEPASRLLAHQDACVPRGFVPDRLAYQHGWQQGIAEYCIPENGFVVGERGEDHANVCPAAQRGAFLAAFERGRNLWLARDRVASLERAVAGHRLRLESIDGEIAVVVAAQIDPTLLPVQRVELAARVKQLYDEKARLRGELPALEAELQRRAAELERLGASLAATSP